MKIADLFTWMRALPADLIHAVGYIPWPVCLILMAGGATVAAVALRRLSRVAR